MKIVSIEQMQEIEYRAETMGLPPHVLMEQAGFAFAQTLKDVLGTTIKGKSAVALIGPGNNGIDGLIASKHLKLWGMDLTVYLCTERPDDDPNLQIARESGIEIVKADHPRYFNRLQKDLSKTDIIIDAIFGIGRSRRLRGTIKQITTTVNKERQARERMTVVALDLPTGLNANTGEVDESLMSPDITISLGYPKIGFFKFPGATKIGRLLVANIGLPENPPLDRLPTLLTTDWVRETLPLRPYDSNKGNYGKVLVIAGSQNYIGAAFLACMGAARAGAGNVTLGTLASVQQTVATLMPDTTYLPLTENVPGEYTFSAAEDILNAVTERDALLIGCGLGTQESTQELIREISLGSPRQAPSMILDADALNTLAETDQWWQRLRFKSVITPHPKEMARLLKTTVKEVQNDRIACARDAALRWGVTVILKGAFSIIASPEGEVRINPFANPILATSGTGDVLAGLVTGFIAQNVPPYDAACLGAFIHAATGESLAVKYGDRGALASELLPLIPITMKDILAGTFMPVIGQ